MNKIFSRSTQDIRWCPGCGDYIILNTIIEALNKCNIPKEKVVFISGIGCSSRLPYYINTYGFHTIHGRAFTIATGLAITRPDLCIFIITGDGDAVSIGTNHLIHLLRRNINVNILLFNNKIYGLTKGQYSPTSDKKHITPSSPDGIDDNPINIALLAIASGGTCVIRTFDFNRLHMLEMILYAIQHKGTSLVEIYQNCNIFNDKVHEKYKDVDNVIYLQNKNKIIFNDNKQCLVYNNIDIESATIDNIDDDQIIRHNINNKNLALSLSNLSLPLVVGILYNNTNREPYSRRFNYQYNSIEKINIINRILSKS